MIITMLFKIMSVSTLSVVALLAQTSTLSSIHHHRARALYSDKSDSASRVRRDISQAELFIQPLNMVYSL